jgi:hypothetical protein
MAGKKVRALATSFRAWPKIPYAITRGFNTFRKAVNLRTLAGQHFSVVPVLSPLFEYRFPPEEDSVIWPRISLFTTLQIPSEAGMEKYVSPMSALRRTALIPLVAQLLAFTLFLVPQTMCPQSISHTIVTGRVLDDSTRSPLPLTNVFVSNSTIGAAADSGGRFVLRDVQLGNQQIVASLVGYVAQTKMLHLIDTAIYEMDFHLRQQPVQVGGVDVEAKEPKEWKVSLQRFLKEFLGSSPNADQCKVLNPEVLDFATGGTGMFTATARGPLEIQNLMLGYQVRCFLDYYTSSEKPLKSIPSQSREPRPTPKPAPSDAFSPRTYAPPPVPVEPLAPMQTQTTIELLCRTRFTPLESRDEKELTRWKENRRKTYLGSLRHFLTSLVQNNSEKQGFEVYEIYAGRNSDASTLRWKVEAGTLFTRGEFGFERALSFTALVQVVYEDGNEALTSSLLLSRPSVIFYINGMLADPLSVTTYGRWSNQRVADMLPTDYTPENK